MPAQTAPIAIKPLRPQIQAPKVEIMELPLIIGDKEAKVHAILHGGYNYVQLRDILAALGFTVENDPFESIPVISAGITAESGESGEDP
ncbi:MAG: hypothetical protein LBU32_10015 [Clostridiales bacterium]|jgi:hypothetical protein|nr:hypothetical protein [Clostridiales bacterium]